MRLETELTVRRPERCKSASGLALCASECEWLLVLLADEYVLHVDGSFVAPEVC